MPASDKQIPSRLPSELAGPRGARAVLLAAMLTCSGLILWWAGDRIFAIDEWAYFVDRSTWSADSFFEPFNGHLLALPLLVYEVILALFGATSHLPLTLLTIVLHLAVVALLYAIASRRVGPWPALLPAIVILMLGSGWEVMVNTAAMQNQFGIIAGLGAFISLERLGRRGDPLTALLLAASIASFTIGLAFALGAGAWILLERRSRSDLRRLWLVVAPIVLYLVWFAWARKFGQSEVSSSALATLGSGIVDQLSSIIAGLTGLYASAIGIADQPRALPLVFVLLGLLAWRLARGPRPSPSQGAALVTFAGYLVLVALGLSDIRSPVSSRYIYMGAVLLVLVAIEFAPELRIGRAWLPAVAVVALLALMANVGGIKYGGDFFEDESAYNRAELGVLELAREQVDPAFVPEPPEFGDELVPHRDLGFPIGLYFSAVDRLGSPADSPSEIASEPASARAKADEISAQALGITLAPAAETASSGAPPVAGISANAELSERGSCTLVDQVATTAPAVVAFTVPTAGLSFDAASVPSSVSIGRFADDLPVTLGPTSRRGSLRIPSDASSVPWRVSFQLAGRGRICG